MRRWKHETPRSQPLGLGLPGGQQDGSQDGASSAPAFGRSHYPALYAHRDRESAGAAQELALQTILGSGNGLAAPSNC
jgi:hypothetical protein